MPYRSKLATIYLLGFFLDLLNMFIANVAYPDITRSLGATIAQLSWVGNAYMLGLTMIIPLSVWLATAVGERSLIIASLSLFTLASLMAGLAGSIEVLIGWRLLQGLAGGLLIPVGQAMTYRNYPPAERARLTSLVMMVALIVPAISPAVGGIVVDAFSWRWIFFVNLPVALLILALAVYWLVADMDVHRRLPFDFAGLILGSAAMASLLLALTFLGEKGAAYTGVGLLAGAGLLTAIYVRQALRNTNPILDLHLIKGHLLRTSMLVYLFVPGVFIGTSLLATLYLQESKAMAAASTGALMLPWALASFLAIGLTRRYFNRVGPRPLLVIGAFLQSAGILLLSQGAMGAHYPTLTGAFALMGMGGSLCSSTAQNMAFLDVKHAQMGQVSAVWNINRQLSFCLGVTVMSGLLNTLLGMHVQTVVANDPTAAAFKLCFLIAAALTLIPVPFVLRIHTRDVLHLVQQTSSGGNPS